MIIKILMTQLLECLQYKRHMLPCEESRKELRYGNPQNYNFE